MLLVIFHFSEGAKIEQSFSNTAYDRLYQDN